MMRGSDQSYEMSDEMRSIRVMGGFVILKGIGPPTQPNGLKKLNVSEKKVVTLF